MMDATTLVDRLRDQCPGLKIVDEALAMDDAATRALTTPAAFVVQLSETAVQNQFMGAHIQDVTVAWAVIIGMRGIRSASVSLHSELATIRNQVLAALIGWTPDPAISPLNFTDGQLLAKENNIIWWQDAFSCRFDRRST